MRSDGRKNDELRPIRIEAGALERADGSCYIEWGKNKVMAAVYGPRELHPKHLQDPTRAKVQCRYNMAPFSVEDRKRPGPSRRSTEISKVISETFENVIFLRQFPRSTIDIFIEVLQADAGTRCAGIAASSVALADAGIPMKSLVSACAAGKVNNEIVLDLTKEEDQEGQADMPLAIAQRTKEVLLLQMDGHLTIDEFNHAVELAKRGCEQIYKLQHASLKELYK